MPRKKSGIPKQVEPKPLTLAAHLPDTSAELQPHVATMLSAIAADTRFTAIAADVTKGQTDNGTLATAIQDAKNGGETEKQAMLAADKVIRQDVREIVPKVQGILRKVSPDLVPGVLATILLYQSHVGERPPKSPLEAKDPPKGSPPGTVLLVALAIAGALTYDYELSTDQVTWTLAAKSGKSRVTVSGLTPGKQYWFRVSAFLRDDTTTQPIVSMPHIVR